jgi:putative oxidoreductase
LSSPSKHLGAPIFRGATPRHREIGLTILRVVVGAIFVAHGVQKFFLFGIPAVAEGFAQSGIVMPAVMAPFITLVELLGGIALVAGLLTRLAALGTAFTMLGAISLVHIQNGFFNPNGFEYPAALLAASVAIVLMGPGNLSLDAVIARRMEPAASMAGRVAGRRAA